MSEMNDVISVLVADDTLIAREGWKSILETEKDIQWIGEAAFAQEVLAQVQKLRPDILLIDLKWFEDETAGETAIKQVKDKVPGTGIIAITAYPALFVNARKVGADGTLPKGFSRAELVGMIRAVNTNRSFPAPQHGAQQSGELLSNREKEVVILVAEGKSDKEIAAALHIEFHTARNHVRSVLSKLGATNRTHAVAIAREKGVID